MYEIVGDYGPEDAVPPTAIKGAWRVDDNGEIVGEFLPNPVFEGHEQWVADKKTSQPTAGGLMRPNVWLRA